MAPRIGITISTWKRPRLLDCVLHHTTSVIGPDDRIVVVGSEKEARRLAAKNGVEYVSANNSPLGRKRNAGIQPFRKQVDAVIVLNDDDFISADLLQTYRGMIQKHPVVGLEGLVFLVRELGKFVVWTRYANKQRQSEGIGPGRLIRADVLNKLGWNLWPDGQQYSLDAAVAKVLPKIHLLPIEPGYGLVDVKPVNTRITSWAATRKVAEKTYVVQPDQLPFPKGTFWDFI